MKSKLVQLENLYDPPTIFINPQYVLKVEESEDIWRGDEHKFQGPVTRIRLLTEKDCYVYVKGRVQDIADRLTNTQRV